MTSKVRINCNDRKALSIQDSTGLINKKGCPYLTPNISTIVLPELQIKLFKNRN